MITRALMLCSSGFRDSFRDQMAYHFTRLCRGRGRGRDGFCWALQAVIERRLWQALMQWLEASYRSRAARRVSVGGVIFRMVSD